METNKKRFRVSGLIFALLMAGEAAFVLDMLTTRAVTNLPAAALALAFAAFFVLFALASLFLPRQMKWIFQAFTLAFMAAALMLLSMWHSVFKTGPYQDVDSGKAELFAGKRVMVIVPHQTDEMALMSGVLEQYVKYGSNVYIVYAMNRDSSIGPTESVSQASAAAAACGVPAGNLIFLGYGEGMNADGQPFYYCPEDAAVSSPAGFEASYGITGYPAFSPGKSYSRGNLQTDLQDVLLRYMPDVIYCTEMDGDTDHQALAMLFEKAMGQVLKTRDSYRPQVFRGFVGEDMPVEGGYYRRNIGSTAPYGEQGYVSIGDSNVCAWEARIRLPVYPGNLARSLLSSQAYQALSQYSSQPTEAWAEKLIRGDKLFWYRETGSLCLEAELWTSSGDKELLRDFVLTDRVEQSDSPGASVNTWVPEPDDRERRVIIKFPEPRKLSRVVLYDNPSLTDNVLETAIRFEDGSFIMTGPLAPNGSGTEVSFDSRLVSQLEICIMDSEGQAAGYTELELYPEPYQPPFRFVKLTNAAGDFVYDYYIDPSGTERFSLYAYGCSEELVDYRFICIGDGCQAFAEDGCIVLNCPEGKSCQLTLMDDSGQMTDTVYIHNGDVRMVKLAQYVEQYLLQEFNGGANSNTLKLLDWVRRQIGESDIG